MKRFFILILISYNLGYAGCAYVACDSESMTGQMQVNINTVNANKKVIEKLKELQQALNEEKKISDMNIEKHKQLLDVQKMKQYQLDEILFIVEQKNQLIYKNDN